MTVALCTINRRMAAVNSRLHMEGNIRKDVNRADHSARPGAVHSSVRPSVVRQVQPWVNQVETAGRRATRAHRPIVPVGPDGRDGGLGRSGWPVSLHGGPAALVVNRPARLRRRRRRRQRPLTIERMKRRVCFPLF